MRLTDDGDGKRDHEHAAHHDSRRQDATGQRGGDKVSIPRGGQRDDAVVEGVGNRQEGGGLVDCTIDGGPHERVLRRAPFAALTVEHQRTEEHGQNDEPCTRKGRTHAVTVVVAVGRYTWACVAHSHTSSRKRANMAPFRVRSSSWKDGDRYVTFSSRSTRARRITCNAIAPLAVDPSA